MSTTTDAAFPLPSAEELLRCAYLRLLPSGFSPDPGHFRYAKPVAEGLTAAIALDLPDSVRVLDDADVEQQGYEVLAAAARANLVSMPVDHELTYRPDGTAIHLINGKSFFVASKALVLEELVRQVTGSAPPAEGVLVAMPWRHHMAFHPIVDATVLTALNDLTGYALGAYSDPAVAGPLSPRLYWWRDGDLVSVTQIDKTAKAFEPALPPELLGIIRRLCGR